jgi:spermidine/putrescine transport system ATP-binding protein
MIELRNLSKKFGSFTAVDDITLSIRAGEFLTLLGPSGCGKTTLLRMIAGFESPDRGQVFLNGIDVTPLPPYRREVNQVFQSYALFPHLTVGENVAFGLKMRGMPRPAIAGKVADMVKLVSLTGMENRRPDQLSGGQRQRVALARALVCEPRVLLLDEPLAALDAKLRRSMQIELKRLQSRVGITFVFVTHDQEEAITMSDRIAVMNGGKIEQLGTPAEMYHRPATKFVATFLGQTNLLPAKVIATNRVILSDTTELTCDTGTRTVGQEILLSIRPERVSFNAAGNDNVIPVTVVERIFKGAFEQFLIRTTRGLELIAVQSQPTLTIANCQIMPVDIVVVG